MKAKHIKGPWRVEEEGTQFTIYGPEDKFTTVVYKEEFARDGEMEATARLIAAAPDLLAALTEAVDFIWDEMRENPDKEDMDGSIMDRLIELQTALISARRKATGA